MKNLKGSLILLLTALIWGTAFVAQATASVGTFTFNATRTLVAACFLLLVLLGRKALFHKPLRCAKRAALGGVLLGVCLFIAMSLQQGGIDRYPAGVAASGRAGFLTATYVVMVALCAHFSGRQLHPVVFVASVGCLAGMYLLCLSGGIGQAYWSDLLLLGCAVGFTVYILIVDRFSAEDGVMLSCIQFFVCAVLSGIAAAVFETPSPAALRADWLPILYAGILSSGVGYTLQILGQKFAEPAVASIVMSLESVFAALSGWVLLHEQLSARELWGCALVFGAVLLAQSGEWLLARKQKKCGTC